MVDKSNNNDVETLNREFPNTCHLEESIDEKTVMLNKIKKLEAKVREMKKENDSLKLNRNKMERKMVELKKENETIKKERNGIAQEKDSLEQDLDAKIKTMDTLEKDFANITKSRDALSVQYSGIISKLSEQIECPVCLEVPTSGPVYVCPNGHFVCSKCKGSNCPTCRDRMFNGKSLLAVTVLENIDHKCRNDSCGKLLPLEDYKLHLKSCPHRIVLCPAPAQLCGKMMGLSKVCAHILSNCQGSYNKTVDHLIVDNFPKQLTYYCGKEENEVIKGSALCWKGIHFYLGIEKVHGYAIVSLQLFGSASECQNYIVDIGVYKSEDAKKMEGTHVQKLTGSPLPIDLEPALRKVNGLMVGPMQLEKILNEKMRIGILLDVKNEKY